MGDIGLISEIEASEAVKAELCRGFQAKRALAEMRNRRVQAASRQMESRLMDGIGQLTHRIDSDVYWLMRNKFGPDCWTNNEFLKDCEKHGTISRVRGRSDKITVDMGGRS